jgi:hypothetical protein
MSTKILKETHNSEIFLRPRFSLELELPVQEVIDHFKEELEKNSEGLRYKCVDHHMVLDVPIEQDHYWSPQMHLEIRKSLEGKASTLKGVLGPKTGFWTMFVFLHVAMGLAFLAFGIRGYVYWTLKVENQNSFRIMGLITLVWLALYLFARWSRRRGSSQTLEMVTFMKRALDIEDSEIVDQT